MSNLLEFVLVSFSYNYQSGMPTIMKDAQKSIIGVKCAEYVTLCDFKLE